MSRNDGKEAAQRNRNDIALMRDSTRLDTRDATRPGRRTGGGAHLVFICRDLPESVAKSKKALSYQITPAVTAELYTDGMNFVLSPSVHKSGHRYAWEITGDIPEITWDRLKQWFGFVDPAEAKRGRLLFGETPDRKVQEQGVWYALELCMHHKHTPCTTQCW